MHNPLIRTLLGALGLPVSLFASGSFTVAPLTGDADSGITADASYTHALDFNDTGNQFAWESFLLRDRSVVVGLGGFEVTLGQEILGRELLGSLVFLLRVHHRGACPFDVGFGRDEVGLGLAYAGVEARGVEPRDYLALLDRGVEVGAEALDGAGDLGAYLDRGHRLQRARGPDRLHDVAAV